MTAPSTDIKSEGTFLLAKDLDFSCVSCGDKVEELQCLPCLHSVSVCEKKECRHKMLTLRVSCSQCKEVFDVPVDGFPCHSFAGRNAARKERTKDTVTFCCAEHDPPREAVVYCSTCPGPLCEECRSAHQNVALLIRHKTSSLDDFHKRPSISETPLCPTHGEFLHLYCVSCNVLICSVCNTATPHNCDPVLVVNEELGMKNKRTLRACVASSTRELDTLDAAMEEIDRRLENIDHHYMTSKAEVNRTIDELMEGLKLRRDALVADLDKANVKRRRELEHHREHLQLHRVKLTAYRTAAEEIIENASIQEQIPLSQVAVNRLHKLLTGLSSCQVTSPPIMHYCNISSGTKVRIIEAVKTLGMVDSVSPQNSTMEGLVVSVPNNVVICRPLSKFPLSFKVVTRDHSGSQCVFGGENVRAVLTPTTCGVPVLGQVEDNRDGTYHVEFKYVPSNLCELVVTVNGSHIKYSPVKVKIGYPPLSIRQEIKDHKQKRTFRAITFSKKGLLLATDSKNKEICIFNEQAEFSHSFKVKDAEDCQLNGIVELSNGMIAVSLKNHIGIYTPKGEFIKHFGSNRLKKPSGLAVNSKGQLFVADNNGDRVSVFGVDQSFQTSFDELSEYPQRLSDNPAQIFIGRDGLVYVCDGTNNCVVVLQQDGCLLRQFGKNVLSTPRGIAITKYGDVVVVTSSIWYANSILIFNPYGSIAFGSNTLGLHYPFGVAIDDTGFIFVADSGNGRIVKI